MTQLQGDFSIPKQGKESQGFWVEEGHAPELSETLIGSVKMSPKTVGAMTDLTRKTILQSSIDLESWLRADLAKTLALTIDKAIISGSGKGAEPKGLLTLAQEKMKDPKANNINVVMPQGGGKDIGWEDIVSLETMLDDVDAATGSTLAYLTNARVRGHLKTTPKSAANPSFIWPEGTGGDSRLNGYYATTSNLIPKTLGKTKDQSAIIFGAWENVIMGEWGPGLDVQVNPYISSAGSVRIRLLLDVDIIYRMLEHFAVMPLVSTPMMSGNLVGADGLDNTLTDAEEGAKEASKKRGAK